MGNSSFEVFKTIGRGACGIVYLGKSKKTCKNVANNQLVVLKVISKTKGRSIMRETEALKAVKNKVFLSQMLGKFHDRMSVFIILRYEQSGCLLDFINRSSSIPLDCAQGIVVEIVLGLKALHVQNIVHADLKPENILLDKNLRAHVADFGHSVLVRPARPFIGHWGTETYQTPEQLLNDVIWDHRVDYVNVGVIFLLMVTGKNPFGNDDGEIQRNVVKLNFRMPDLKSEDAKSFVRHSVCFLDNRFSCNSVTKHPFISSKIRKVIDSYVADDPVIVSSDTTFEPYFDNINFFPPIHGVSFDEEVANNDVTMIDVTANDATNDETQHEEGAGLPSVTRRNEQNHPPTTVATNNDTPTKDNMATEEEVDEDPTCLVVAAILDQQMRNKKVEGTVIKVGVNQYKIQCSVCGRLLTPINQLRNKKKGKKRNWSCQPYLRHLKNVHELDIDC